MCKNPELADKTIMASKRKISFSTPSYLKYEKGSESASFVDALFVIDRTKYKVLVNITFKKWVKVNKILDNHASNTYHINAATVPIDNPERNVDVRMNAEHARNIEENRHIVLKLWLAVATKRALIKLEILVIF